MDDHLVDLASRRRRQQSLSGFALDALTHHLDALRGWREDRDQTLHSAHILTPLATLTRVDEPQRDSSTGAQEPSSSSSSGERLAPLCWDVHAPEVLVGRYSHHVGPVDLVLHGLLDHEIYPMSSPHIRLAMVDEKTWHLTRLAPKASVQINGEVVDGLHQAVAIKDADIFTLGVVALRFSVARSMSLHTWKQRQRDLLRTQTTPALFLKRHGGLCGPRFALDSTRAVVLGRSFPQASSLEYDDAWPKLAPPDWSLSGLPDHERRHVAFRHATLRPIHDHDWEISPLSVRHDVTVNRLSIRDATPLQDGDEIGLGNVLFYFHHPTAESPSTRHTIKIPHVVDWHAERPVKPPPSPQDAHARSGVSRTRDEEHINKPPF